MNAEGRAPWQKKGWRAWVSASGSHRERGGRESRVQGAREVRRHRRRGDVASRCEGLNKTLGTEILCTSSTWEHLPEL